MSSLKLALGAEVDIATGDEVRDAVKGGTDTILNRLGRSAARGNRRRIPASYSLAASSTGSFVLDFGSPQGNYLWWLVEVVITGADDRTTSAAAVAALYCGAPARQMTSTAIIDTPPLGTLVRPAVAIPSVFQFNKEVWPVQDGENLFAIVYSPTTPLTVVSGIATVIELDASLVTLDRM